MSGGKGPDIQGSKVHNLPGNLGPVTVKQQLEKILASRLFIRSERLRRFLRFTVDSALNGEPDKLKEYLVGVQVFDRGDDFDPRADAIVRTEATRLRRKLAEFYRTEGQRDPIVITMPRGGYVPHFERPDDRSGPSVRASESQRGRSDRWSAKRVSLVVSLGVVGIVLAIGAVWRSTRVKSPPASALQSVPVTTLPGWEREPALSPDGDQVAFVWGGGRPGNDDIYLKLIDTGPPLRLTTDPGAESFPAWSPDGSQLAFLRKTDDGAELFQVPALGGPERRLAKLSMPSHGISWSPDGRFIAVEDHPAGETNGIFLISAATGEKRRLTTPPVAYYSDRWPAFSPDGGSLAFARGRTNFHIHVLPLDENGLPAGEARRLTLGPLYLEGLGWMPDGRTIVFAAHLDELWWRLFTVPAQAEGAEPEPLRVEAVSAKQPSTSRPEDGSKGRLMYVSYSSDSNIYRVPGIAAEINELPPAPLLTVGSSRYDTAPSFSPDGDRIVFVSDRTGNPELWVANGDGSNQKQITSLSGPSVGGPRWSPDGERIVFDAAVDDMDVFAVGADGGAVQRLTTEPSTEGGATWSRDGRWLYYLSDASGEFEIRRMPAEGGPSVRIVKRGLKAFESPDGKWLYYTKHFPAQGEPGVWRTPVDGGEEERVLAEGVSGAFAISQSGIYLLQSGQPGRLPAIESFLYDTWERTIIFEFPASERFGLYNALAVSDDDRSVLFVQYDQSEADLMLVDGFP